MTVAAEAVERRFLLDSGIGVTVVSSSFAARSDVVATAETFAGRRMSGQIVELPLVVLPPLRLGDLLVEDHVAGVLDLGSTQGLTGFDGILSLGFFGAHPYTVDPVGMTLTVGRAGADPVEGTVVPLEVHRDGPSRSVFAQLVLPSGRTVSVEVDTGSQTLILDERFLGDCGLTAGDPGIETTTGTDETGHEWVRHWAVAPGDVHLAAAPQLRQTSPRVQFQKIIYDGLLGSDFLDRHRVTYDIATARMLLDPLS